MSGTTANRGFPYPTDLDLVQQTDEAIQALAEAVDALGIMGVATRTADQAAMAGAVDFTGLSVTFTAIAGHTYRIQARAHLQTNGADVNTSVAIMEGATQLAAAAARLWSTAAVTCSPLYLGTFAAGAHTVKLQAAFSGGSNTSRAAANNPAYLTVEDLGG